MKRVYSFLFCSILLMNCSKPDMVKNNEQNQAADIPTASFKVNNEFSPGNILEGNIVDFENESTKACSYEWNFGNGITSNSRVPTNISYLPCGGQYTITLKAKAANGQVASFSKVYDIQCRGKNAGAGGKSHQHEILPVVHWGLTEIHAYQESFKAQN
jgi:hypothetical protein